MKRKLIRSRSAAIALTVVASIGLAACSAETERKSGQAVAKVNGTEVTVHQINAELRDVTPEQIAANGERIKKQAVDALIERQLLVAAAIDEKIDRDPDVMQAIVRAREQILAQAFLQRKLTSGATPPTLAEAEEYHRANPALFSDRKSYQMQQIVVPGYDYTADMKAAVDSAKSLDDIAAWLDSRKVPYARGQAVRNTAELPPQLVPNLTELGKGRPFVTRDSGQLVVATLTYLRDVPVSKEEALPQIQRYLANKKARDTAAATIAGLRASAEIDYLGQDQAAAATPPASAPQASQPPKAAQPVQPAQASGVDTPAAVDGSIARGVAGLR